MTENNNKKLIDGAISWWNLVRPQDGYDRYKGDRADLRRCHSTTDAVFLPVYHLLLEKSGADSKNSEQLKSLAVTAWVLSWVNSESEIPFAEQLAKSDPQFQAVRFRRLLETSEWDDLGMQLIRALKFTKRTTNVRDLIKSIVYWNTGSFVKEQWALSYYRFAENQKKND